MKFSCTREHLQKALRSVSGVAGRNPTLPILRHVLLHGEQGRLRLSATDLEVGVMTWITGRLENGEAGITIPLKPLAEYVQNLPGDRVQLSLDAATLTLSSGGSHASFQGESAENFPLIPTVEQGVRVDLPVTPVVQALSRTLYAAATDDTRPELSGLFLSLTGTELILAATDSYRLAESRVTLPAPAAEDVRAILPLRAAQEIQRVLEGGEEQATLLLGESQLRLETPSTHLVSRLIEGTYPDYTQIIPKTSGVRASVLRHDLLRAVRGAGIFTSGDASSVLLETTASALRVTAVAQELGETAAEVVAEVQGESVRIHFNPRFLLDALSIMPSERISVGLTNASVPVVIRPEGDQQNTTLALVMPIKT